MTCAYQKEWSTSSSTITYGSIISDYKNSDDVNGGDGVMNIHTGAYTVIKPAGHYTVTFTGNAYLEPDEYVELFVYHNGTQVPETRWWSRNSEDNGGYMDDAGSKTVTLHLNPEDTLEIRTATITGTI